MFAAKKWIMSELKFTKEHEWIIIKDEVAIIGISDFAQEQLGDIVSIELPKAAGVFKQGQTMAIVDSVKASRSEEHTSELQSQSNLVCRLLLEKKKKKNKKKK